MIFEKADHVRGADMTALYSDSGRFDTDNDIVILI